ncbi:MAG TPA: TolC family protein [Methylomirabilota bacterium]|nr:TolC family protein [Methylomirabilota bacterium]
MWRALGLFVLIAAISVGCTAKHYRKSADKEAAAIISEKSPAVPNMETNFTIEPKLKFALDSLPVSREPEEAFGPERNSQVGARILTLDQALDIAVDQSRQYQNQKEIVFLQALSLTLARWRFTPIFRAGGSSEYQTRVLDVQEQIERITGTQIIRENTVVQETQHNISSRGSVGVNWLLRTGGRLSADFTTDFLYFITGNNPYSTRSRLAATLSQPLLRGAGYKVAMENLTQSERDVLYALRNFVQFRKAFSVQVASAYYNVLQNRDTMRNTWLGLQNFRQNVEQEKAFAAEGQRTQTSLGQLQQAELSTETRWVSAVRAYKASLDQFKILIGLSTDANIVLAEEELGRLSIVHPNVEVTNAVQIALAHRLDLWNTRDAFEDAARARGIAKNFLLPELDLVLRGDVENKPGNRPLALDFQRARWSAGVDFDLPIDRKSERNNYRASLIAYDRAGRELELAVDQIKFDVQENWRALDQARRNHQIAVIGVELSERRVEEQELLFELGRGQARDLVDARLDLINSRNQLTAALVQHTIARLEFWRDLGILHIREDGKWEEVQYVQN